VRRERDAEQIAEPALEARDAAPPILDGADEHIGKSHEAMGEQPKRAALSAFGTAGELAEAAIGVAKPLCANVGETDFARKFSV
jgi:hypothetical protein